MEDIKVLAKNLINYSVKLNKGEKVLIEGNILCKDLIIELIKETYKVGGYPFVNFSDIFIKKELLTGTSKEHV